MAGVSGRRGAGKSTVLKAIFGYLRPWQGRVAFDGQSLVGLRPDQVMHRGIGFVAQAGGLFADMTVHENLLLGGHSLGSRRAVPQEGDAAPAQTRILRQPR